VIKKESFEITILGNVCLSDEVGVGHGLLYFEDGGSLLKCLVFLFFSVRIDERGGDGLIWVIILKEFGSSTGIHYKHLQLCPERKCKIGMGKAYTQFYRKWSEVKNKLY
jgi:hypothetical protein